ncbi:MAG: ABC-F family ATP-binding cassette domain-containing protein [Desulfitobacterium hafniense]|nr:ABC-F family ATP-binding cassette domain-containing protein [Desulfitobacterium hafniense]
MSMLYCRDCGVDVSGEPLFRQVSFGIEAGEKVGLVGPNGVGKTSLLRALIGEIRLESGSVVQNGNYGYLPQTLFLEDRGVVIESMLSERSDILEMRAQLGVLEEKMACDPSDKIFEQYSKLTEAYESSGGYALETQIRRILAGLGLDKEAGNNIANLSGGQKTRLALAKLLLRSPDLLILDEPTNHLDIEATEWLEGFLKDYPGAVLVVSHDRYFLDQFVSKIVSLSNGGAKVYSGNFSEYELQKAIDEVTIAREAERLNRRIARLQDYIRKNKAGVNAKQARGRQTQLDRLTPIESRKTDKNLKISLGSVTRSGDRVLTIDLLAVAFGSKVLFKDLNLELRRGDRVALLGRNGVGKTTLFRAILDLVPYQGFIKTGANVKIGYYSQQHEELDLTGSIMDEIRSVSSLKELEIRSLLARFGFRGEEVFKPASVLSGGEKSRLALAKLFLAGGNLLLLDEPTNHLDAETREVLEEALQDFDGTILVISHDRYFLDKVVNRICELEKTGLVTFEGDYSSFKGYRQQLASQERESQPLEPMKVKNNPSRDNQRREKKLRQLEEQITDLERSLRSIEEDLASSESDYERALELHGMYEQVKAELDEVMDQWLELSS